MKEALCNPPNRWAYRMDSLYGRGMLADTFLFPFFTFSALGGPDKYGPGDARTFQITPKRGYLVKVGDQRDGRTGNAYLVLVLRDEREIVPIVFSSQTGYWDMLMYEPLRHWPAYIRARAELIMEKKGYRERKLM